MKEPFLFLRSNQMYRFGYHQNVWFSLSYFVTLGKILLIECNQWAPPWIQCNDQTASPSQCPKWPLKHCKIGFLMVLFISFLYSIEILRNLVISSIFVCVLLCRTQFSTVWNISLSFRLWIFMQIRRHGIYNRCCISPCIKPNCQTKNLLLKGIQLKICFLNNFLNRCKSLPAYLSLDIYI